MSDHFAYLNLPKTLDTSTISIIEDLVCVALAWNTLLHGSSSGFQKRSKVVLASIQHRKGLISNEGG